VSRGYPWLKILADLSISMPADPFQIHALLKRWFGFKSFRPLQEEIIRDALAHKDVLVVLPTGGGKSLCFQLPALARGGVAADCVDEGSGGCVASGGRAGDVFEFLARAG
jgi:superfamily II DNA/RNA helicase